MQQYFSEVVRGPLSGAPVNTNDRANAADRSVVPAVSTKPVKHAAPPYRLGELASMSPQMRGVFDLLHRVGPTEVTLTFAGETGTGKDVLANAVHDLSPRGRRSE